MALFIEYYGPFLKITAEGQVPMREVLESHLRRVECDPTGIPAPCE